MNARQITTARAVAAACLAPLAAIAIAVPYSAAVNAAQPASSGSSLGRPFSTTAVQRSAERSAEISADFSSIFTGQIADAVNSGWASCPTPIVWSADLHELTPAEASREVANLDWAFGQWSQVSGLTFQYGGPVALSFNSSAFTLSPTDGTAPAPRQIYLDFIGSKETSMLSGSTVGLGSPSSVMMSTKEIQAGTAIFRTEHVESIGAKDPRAIRSLYLHELGHVLGLAHAQLTANVMYPIVTDHTTLGSGDVRGVQAMTKPCATPAPADPAPAGPTESAPPAPTDPAPTTPPSTDPEPTDPAPADPTASTPPTSPTPPAPSV